MAQFNNLEDAINADKKKMLKFVREVPRTIASELKNQIDENFDSESFDNDKWKQVNKTRRKKKFQKKPILFNTGNLKRSIKIVSANWNEIKIKSGLDYASAHNNGTNETVNQTVKEHTRKGKKGKTTVRQHTRVMKLNIPKRQFMGHGKNADALIKKVLDEEMHERGIVQ